MVQIKVLSTFLFAATVILPALAAPLNIQESDDLLSREYDDLDLEAREPMSVAQVLKLIKNRLGKRELDDDLDLEAREPLRFGGAMRSFGRGIARSPGVRGALFGREFDENDLEAREPMRYLRGLGRGIARSPSLRSSLLGREFDDNDLEAREPQRFHGALGHFGGVRRPGFRRGGLIGRELEDNELEA